VIVNNTRLLACHIRTLVRANIMFAHRKHSNLCVDITCRLKRTRLWRHCTMTSRHVMYKILQHHTMSTLALQQLHVRSRPRRSWAYIIFSQHVQPCLGLSRKFEKMCPVPHAENNMLCTAGPLLACSRKTACHHEARSTDAQNYKQVCTRREQQRQLRRSHC